mmetsp:Transcript_7062/g.10393  ORF Transcript_7062/g.10393 Transcript_7062/m.10393 type:complete len:513 (+) Transcript_7062:84-1622(+)
MDSNRADVGELNAALRRPSPLGRVLDDLHGQECYSPTNSEQRSLSGLQTINEYSMFGSSSVSVASSVARTIVDGVQHSIAHWKVLLFGQAISFCLAAAGAASEELNGRCNVSVPLTQTALVGFLLMLLGACKMKGWGSGRLRAGQTDWDNHEDEEEESFCSHEPGDHNETMIRQSTLNDQNDDDIDDGGRIFRIKTSPLEKSKSQPRSFCFGRQTIHAPLWLYFIVALVAVEARYLIFLSFRYTSFTFIYLVDALAIPSAMAFSKLLLKRDYHFVHLLGGVVCICGIVTNTVSDLKGTGSEVEQIGSREDVNSVEHLYGDFLAIGGAVLLGLDDVLSEMLIKDYGGTDELLFMKWFFGVGICLAQLAAFERGDFAELFGNQGDEPCTVSTRLLLLSGYTFFQFLDMLGEVQFLSISEAALLNLSLLTSDLWATIFSVLAVGFVPSSLYFIASLLIVAGIVLYEAAPSPLGHTTPTDIKIKKGHHFESDITERAGNITGNVHLEQEEGNLELT